MTLFSGFFMPPEVTDWDYCPEWRVPRKERRRVVSPKHSVGAHGLTTLQGRGGSPVYKRTSGITLQLPWQWDSLWTRNEISHHLGIISMWENQNWAQKHCFSSRLQPWHQLSWGPKQGFSPKIRSWERCGMLYPFLLRVTIILTQHHILPEYWASGWNSL